MNFSRLFEAKEWNREISALDVTWKSHVHNLMNETHARSEPVSESSVANLLLLQLMLVLILALSWCCYHPCMAWLPCNCYDPLRCNAHASWLHRLLQLVRDTLFFALIMGILILSSVDDCSHRVTHILCKAGDEESLIRQASIWLSFGVSCVIVREICRDSPWCSEAARSRDVDDRLLRLRRDRHCCGAFCKRANVATRPLTADQDDRSVEVTEVVPNSGDDVTEEDDLDDMEDEPPNPTHRV